MFQRRENYVLIRATLKGKNMRIENNFKEHQNEKSSKLNYANMLVF